MKKRYEFLLLFALPGFFVSVFAAFFAFTITAGIIWIFFYGGDTEWPDIAGLIVHLVTVGTFIITWFMFMKIGFKKGKRFEKRTPVNLEQIKNIYMRISILVTIGCIILGFITLLNIRQEGKVTLTPENLKCARACMAKGYQASETIPSNGHQSCNCLDQQSRVIVENAYLGE